MGMTWKEEIHFRKTKRGGVQKVPKEHYLREDVPCGSACCDFCPCNPKTLSVIAGLHGFLIHSSHYLLPDDAVLRSQIDVLEHPKVRDVIILQSCLRELQHTRGVVHKRLRQSIANADKQFYVFMNELHRETYLDQAPDESKDMRLRKLTHKAVLWLREHFLITMENGPKIVFLTNDTKAKEAAVQAGLDDVYTIQEYVNSLDDSSSDIVDCLAKPSPESELTTVKGEPMFCSHLPLSEIRAGIRSGRLVQGTFRGSVYNYREAQITLHDSEETILIKGLANQNRAVDGDIVAAEILPKNEWSRPSNVLADQADDDAETKDIEVLDPALMSEDTEIDTTLSSTDEPSKPTGKVVGVIKRNWRPYCGFISPNPVPNTTYHLFVPTERRIPRIRIETRQVSRLLGQRIVVMPDAWSRYSRYPQGHFVRVLGAIGDKETENEVLLLEHDVPHGNFSSSVLACLPSLPWCISEDQISVRSDFRNLCVCSVDPPGCTDIDDALHCRPLKNGNFEVGVHIADVSHFIRPGTALDKEAARRGTTVYLTDRRIDMVPGLLSSNLCSLRGGEERLAFSILWDLTPDAHVLNTTYHKSIIKSRAALTYAEAQLRIDDSSQHDELAESLRQLNRLAKILKQKRLDAGALQLASSEIRFNIDSETHDPIDVQTKEMRDTNSMVEEFMLLANISSAEKILDEFPSCAVLRRHPAPPPGNFEPLIQAAKSKGFEISVDSGKALSESLDRAVIPSRPYFNTMLRMLTTRCMMQAVYFSCGSVKSREDYLHYGLATPLYTHFTSPIRRYSDILVHRMLAVVIGVDSSTPDLLNYQKLQEVCNNLNFRHRMAQYAGRASVSLHTQLFFRNRTECAHGYVLTIKENAIGILVPKYGLEGLVKLTSKDAQSPPFTYDEKNGTQTAHNGIVFRVFDQVIVQLSVETNEHHRSFLVIKLVKPKIPQFSVDVTLTDDELIVPETSDSHSAPPCKKVKQSN